MLRWESVKQCMCVLTLACWGVSLLRHAASRLMAAAEARLETTVALLHETQLLTHEAAQLTQGPLAWAQKFTSYLPFPLSLGVPALVHHSRACPNPQELLCASFTLLLARIEVLKEYKACLLGYVSEGRVKRSLLISRLVIVSVVGVLVAVVVREFLEVLQATSSFRVESAASQGESRDLLSAQTQKRKPALTPCNKKRCSFLPKPSLSVLPLRPSPFLHSYPASFSSLTSFLSSKSSTSKASSIAPLSSSSAASHSQAPHSAKCSTLSLLVAGIRRARMQLLDVTLRAAWELFVRER
ncbi:hypothetical protein E2C01_016277 [Portunus trituberculatus]|uniref:Transmembrane protein n=1 Tax=Portunus trituberculatus TaxID=210409 RepID=A0A5B7DQM5_PORTR|nr:hypothetical protein [Portunus trituberculatus]